MTSVHPEADRTEPQLRDMTRAQMEELDTLDADFHYLRLAPYMCCSVLFKVIAATQGVGILCLPCVPCCAVSVLLDERLLVDSAENAVLVNDTSIKLDSITELKIDRGFAETCCCCLKRLTIKHTTGPAKTIELHHSRAVRDVDMVRDFILVKREQQINRSRERYRQRQASTINRNELQRELTQIQYNQQMRDKADNIRMAEEIAKLQAKIKYLEQNKQINIPSDNSDCDR